MKLWIGLGLVVISLGRLGAVQEWVDTEAVIDEVVAGSGMAVPASLLRPVAAEIPFVHFRYPHVDEKENVTFIADDPVHSKGGANHGIYRSPGNGGALEVLVRAGETEVPGQAGVRFDYIRGLQPDGQDGGRFVFNGLDLANASGLYLLERGSLRTIVRTGETVVPGERVPVDSVRYGSMQGNSVLALTKTGAVSSLVLWDGAAGGTLRRVISADGKVPAPGREGSALLYISPQNWLDERDVVFRAARVESPYQVEGTAEGQRGIYGWFDVDLADPEAFAVEDLVTVADWATDVPGLPGRRFNDLDSAPVDEGLVAFAGGGAGFRGVYCYDSRAVEPKLRSIVDTETAIPSLFEGTFTSFGMYSGVIGRKVVFVGWAKDYVGVFCHQVDQDVLYLLADNRAPVEGKRIRGIEVSGRLFSGDRFAVMAEFEDGSNGVYLATIPAAGYRRLAE